MASPSNGSNSQNSYMFINHGHHLAISNYQGRAIRSHVQRGRRGQRWRARPSADSTFQPMSPVNEGTVSGILDESNRIPSDLCNTSSHDEASVPLPYQGQFQPQQLPMPVCIPPVTKTTPSSPSSGSPEDEEYRTVSNKSESLEELDIHGRAIQHQRRRHLPSPISILQRGNSDPFNILAVAIDPIDNHVLKFGVEVIFPGRFPPEIRSKSPNQSFENAIKRGIEALHDPITGYGWLSMFTMYFSRAQKDVMLANKALRYKSKASQMLQSQIQESGVSMRPGMVLLYIAELATRDIGAAEAHGRRIGKLYEGVGSFEKVNMDLLERALLIDASNGIISMTRSPFSFPSLELTSLYAQWSDIIETDTNPAPSAPATPSILNPCLKNGVLLDILKALKEVIEFDQTLTSLENLIDAEVFSSMQCHRLILQARLTNHYFDLSECTSTIHPKGDSLEASTTIAALFWSRMYFNDLCMVRMTGFSLFDLQKAVARCDSEATFNLSVPEQQLWILYVGAQAELLMEEFDGGKWHLSRFTAHARSMGLHSWSQIREVLCGFLYSDKLTPNGSDWWWKVAYD